MDGWMDGGRDGWMDGWRLINDEKDEKNHACMNFANFWASDILSGSLTLIHISLQANTGFETMRKR
jgi:hypothetical protein